MKKSVYTIYVSNRFTARYTTTTRNAEDMINELLKMYVYDKSIQVKIYRKTEGEEKVLIYSKNYKRQCK